MFQDVKQNGMSAGLCRFLNQAGFVSVLIVVMLSPWLFGAWEMWWFWPFTACIFAGAFFLGLRMFITAWTVFPDGLERPAEFMPAGQDRRWGVFVLFFPFLMYALVRFLQAEVYMTAERSFLLFLTPLFLGMQIILGFDARQRSWLFRMINVNLCCLGLYGIINHFITGSRYVLWVEGYPSYVEECRATGSYFCPDHFSGIMEIAACLGLGLLLSRDRKAAARWYGVFLVMLGVAGVLLSKSRGGGMALIVIVVFALMWGLSQWSRLKRWCYRVSVLCLLGLVLVVFMKVETSYMKRFKEYFRVERAEGKKLGAYASDVYEKLRISSRGHMISGALRAWKTAPVFGVGPGMHQVLWPYFATSADGNREAGKRPKYDYTAYHSYEVHSDWVQLLEEYGIVGVILFISPVITLMGIILYMRRREHAMALGAVLCCVAMFFHSLGDFNLQMPATVWLLTSIAALPASLLGDKKGVSSDAGCE